MTPPVSPPPLTRVLGLEVGLALQRGWQVVEAERQLPLEGRVLLAESGESPERALTHQLLDGRVAAGDGVRPAWFRAVHGGRRPLRWRGRARWESWDDRGLVWRGGNNQLINTDQEKTLIEVTPSWNRL